MNYYLAFPDLAYSCSGRRFLMRSDNELCFIYTPIAQCCYVTIYWLLQTISVNTVRWACSSVSQRQCHLNNIHFYYYYYYKSHFELNLNLIYKSTLIHVPPKRTSWGKWTGIFACHSCPVTQTKYY